MFGELRLSKGRMTMVHVSRWACREGSHASDAEGLAQPRPRQPVQEHGHAAWLPLPLPTRDGPVVLPLAFVHMPRCDHVEVRIWAISDLHTDDPKNKARKRDC